MLHVKSLHTLALVLVIVTIALVVVDTSAADPPNEGGFGFVCDGFTGCYILADGAWLANTCKGDLATGPFRCERTVEGQTIHAPAPDVFVQITCQTYREIAIFQFQLVYQSHGTVVVRNTGPDEVTVRASCGPNEL
jgi:hypothetical protein